MSEPAARYPVMPPTDPNVERVCHKLRLRSQLGIRKYGTTTDRPDFDVLAWLHHLQEELMDAAIYLECAMKELRQQENDGR